MRLIAAAGAVMSGYGAFSSWQEYQQLQTLLREGRATEANVERAMPVSRGARRPKQCLNYSYTFEAGGRNYTGGIDDDAAEFTASFKKAVSPDAIGTLVVTYLPSSPDVHIVGRVGEVHFGRANRYFWLLGVIALVCGVAVFLPARYYGRRSPAGVP